MSSAYQLLLSIYSGRNARLRASEGKRTVHFLATKPKNAWFISTFGTLFFGGGDEVVVEIKGCKLYKCKSSKVGQLVSCKLGSVRKHVCSFRTRCSGSPWEQGKWKKGSTRDRERSAQSTLGPRDKEMQGNMVRLLTTKLRERKRERVRGKTEKHRERCCSPDWWLLKLDSGKFRAVVWLMIKDNKWMFYVRMLMKLCKSNQN